MALNPVTEADSPLWSLEVATALLVGELPPLDFGHDIMDLLAGAASREGQCRVLDEWLALHTGGQDLGRMPQHDAEAVLAGAFADDPRRSAYLKAGAGESRDSARSLPCLYLFLATRSSGNAATSTFRRLQPAVWVMNLVKR